MIQPIGLKTNTNVIFPTEPLYRRHVIKPYNFVLVRYRGVMKPIDLLCCTKDKFNGIIERMSISHQYSTLYLYRKESRYDLSIKYYYEYSNGVEKKVLIFYKIIQ